MEQQIIEIKDATDLENQYIDRSVPLYILSKKSGMFGVIQKGIFNDASQELKDILIKEYYFYNHETYKWEEIILLM